jgi:NADH:ubiquinone oxidoreductase subunit 4 (subunit M)
MFLIAISFCTCFLIFFSTTLFKLYTLFIAFLALLVLLQVTLNANSLLTVFDYSAQLYRFEFINVEYTLAFDSVTLFFLLLTVLLFIVCLLLA